MSTVPERESHLFLAARNEAVARLRRTALRLWQPIDGIAPPSPHLAGRDDTQGGRPDRRDRVGLAQIAACGPPVFEPGVVPHARAGQPGTAAGGWHLPEGERR